MNCDIIVLVWNLLDYTKECIQAVLKNTAFPYHLIVIDNASNAPTRDYLIKMAQENKDKVTLLRNEENLGFVKAANQGIRAATAAYVCLLNNDTQVSPGWLTEMIKVAEGSQQIGILNPNSNTLGCKPKKQQPLELLAQQLKSYSGEYSELAWATGFCMLIKRKTIEEVGHFDEIYGMGTFEDADFCKRAQSLGYLSVCARGAYVYHREGRSFIKFKKLLKDFTKV